MESRFGVVGRPKRENGPCREKRTGSRWKSPAIGERGDGAEGAGGREMISRVKVKYFKRFADETFELSDHVVLAGPNNSGKTTLLQAIAVWNLGLQKWLAERGTESGSTARERVAIPITRKDFTAIPLREMKLLWTDTSTALGKGELAGRRQGYPRLLTIAVTGQEGAKTWELAMEFRCQSSEQLYVKPAAAH
ncbi:MAG: ATP-binding protein, partial [Planctomycetes bacterium]|nr:ATP-binding protein [Planctomycetota bacterium]